MHVAGDSSLHIPAKKGKGLGPSEAQLSLPGLKSEGYLYLVIMAFMFGGARIFLECQALRSFTLGQFVLLRVGKAWGMKKHVKMQATKNDPLTGSPEESCIALPFVMFQQLQHLRTLKTEKKK